MYTLYGYMDPDELIAERERMAFENEMDHLFEEFYLCEREHQLNMKDIELKAILMEGCTVDDLQMMYEEEEQKTEEKKTGILSAIWTRIVAIFRAIIGKLDGLGGMNLTDSQREIVVETCDLDSLEKVATNTKGALSIAKDIKNTDSSTIEKIGLAFLGGITSGITFKVLTDLDKIPEKIKEFMNKRKTYKAGDAIDKSDEIIKTTQECLNVANEIANKQKTDSNNGTTGTDTNNGNTGDDNKEKPKNENQNFLSKIASIISENFKAMLEKAKEIKDNIMKKLGLDKDKDEEKAKDENKPDDKKPDDKGDGSDTGKGDGSGNDKGDGSGNGDDVKKRAQDIVKDIKKIENINDTININNIKYDDKFYNELINKAKEIVDKSSDDNKENLKDSFEALASKLGKSDKLPKEWVNESVNDMYTSLFESLEHIDTDFENSNITESTDITRLDDIFNDLFE